MHTVTICARNYLPRARVLARSYREHNPSDRFTIFLVDAEPDEVAETDEYRIVGPSTLKLDPSEFQRMAMIYDVTEFCTALKPWALESLLDDGEDTIAYLDPDIEVFESLSAIEALSQKHGIVLTPHTTAPVPRDGLRPSEADLMSTGTFNLGFIALNASNRPLLHWWQERLKRDSVFAPHRMVFVDQRWIDLVPGYFPHTVLTAPGYNVAYWNLDNRRVVADGEKYLVNAEPLYFFHYSGYDLDKPWVLSKYVADNPRVVLSEHGAVRNICDRYRTKVRAAETSAGVSPYRYNTLPTGERITPHIRSVYRQALVEADTRGAEMPPPPFEPGSSAIADWLREPVRAGTQVNRYLYGIWESRPDLRAAFPHPLGGSSADLVNWAWLNVSADRAIVHELLPEPKAPERAEIINSDQPGVNLAGYFLAELGVGQMGRLLVDAVKACGLPYSTVVNRQTSSRQRAHFEEVSTPIRYPVNIAAVNADQFPQWAHEVGPEFFDGRRTVGMWAWEVEEYPEYPVALGMVDEVWTLSEFGRIAISRSTRKPVHVIPLPVSEPPPHRPLDRESLGLPDGPYFLFAFDFFSIFERKNPLGLVEAFRTAFAEGAGPTLVIKSVNGDKCRVDRERLRLACADRRDIVLLESYLTEDDLSSLMGEATAYVSLHRAEGFGLTMAEAMARARPVIGTGYSGNLDFMDADNSRLIPYTLVPVPESSGPYPPTTQWAEPSTAAAVVAMRWVVDNPVEAAELGKRARRSILTSHSLARTVRFVGERVAHLTVTDRPADLPPEPAAPVPLPPGQSEVYPDGRRVVDALLTARQRITGSADLHSPSRAPRLAPRGRRLLQRVLAHHDDFVRHQLESLIDSLELVRSEQQGANVRLETEMYHLRNGLRDLWRGLADLRSGVNEVVRDVSSINIAALPALASCTQQLTADVQTGQDRLVVLNAAVSTSAEQLTALDVRAERYGTEIDGLAQTVSLSGHHLVSVDAQVTDLHSDVAALAETVSRSGQHLVSVNSQLADLQSDVAASDTQLARTIARLDNEQRARPYTSTPDAITLTDRDGHPYFGFAVAHEAGAIASYATFEDVFRGSENFIIDRMRPYVDVIGDRSPVLDLGCGRGEFLELMRATGIAASGVDIDPSMVERARNRGLDVVDREAVAALAQRDPASLGAVTSFQVVEHISVDEVRAMFLAAHRALEPGGVLVAETINPHSPAALKTFWLDLTHVRPLFPESLLFLARECGFAAGRIFFPQGTGELDSDLRECGEYALIATKHS